MALESAPVLGAVKIQDGSGSSLTLGIAQFHNGDQSSLSVGASGGSTNAIITAGPTLLIAPNGLADRQRSVAQDNASPQGVAADVPLQLFQYVTTSGTGAVASAGSVATITPPAMSGTYNGVPWSIQAGTTILYDVGGANVEVILVTSVTGTTFTATFAKTHSAGVVMWVDVYNRQRDAAGEGRGPNGQGAAVAIDYQSISGGPTGTNNYEPEVQVPAKGIGSGALTTATQGTAQVIFSGAPTGLKPGDALWLLGGTAEMVYVSKTYAGGGATTVPLQSNILNTSHTTAQWDIWAINGPGVTPFYPLGVDMDAIALTDPVSGQHTELRQAPGGAGVALVSSDGVKATYRYAIQGFGPVATPTAFLVIQGSATKTVRIKRIKISGVATANGNMQVQMARWSTAGTAGSAVLNPLTAVKHDTGDAAATAVVSTVATANYTTQGTGNAIIGMADRIGLCVTATGVPTPLIWDFATRQDKALILRGTSDFIVLSGAGSAVPAGAAIDLEIETEEDNS